MQDRESGTLLRGFYTEYSNPGDHEPNLDLSVRQNPLTTANRSRSPKVLGTIFLRYNVEQRDRVESRNVPK